jgi:primosomal protein N' (replication factor Y)
VTGTSAIAGGSIARPPVDAERASWPIIELVDRTREEPWRTSLVTSPLIHHLRRPDHAVVCVHNLPGRARILACRSCRSLTRCERCEAAVALADDGTLVCRRCDSRRPPVCLVCGASAFANLRPGVTRLKEELEAAAGRPVVAVTGGDEGPPPAADIYVGTEAVLHRVPRANVVAFLDFDRELLAPRYRAAEQAMALIVRAARLVGPRSAGGRLLVLLADPGRLATAERERRRLLGLPPFAALAEVSGSGSDAWVDALRAIPGVAVGSAGTGGHLVRAPTWDELSRALLGTPRPPRSRIRVAVDPPRR